MARIEGFQARAADGRMVVELGPRYRSGAYDRTTVLSVFHRTIGGGGTFLLEREQFSQLRVWLDGDRLTELRFEDRSHYARLRQTTPGSVAVSAGWFSASGGRGAGVLSPEDTVALAAWVADKDDHGWSGWKELPAGAVLPLLRQLRGRCDLPRQRPSAHARDGARYLPGSPGSLHADRPGVAVTPLTPMELSVLQRMALGDTYGQAARGLGISQDSAQFAGERVRRKLGARNITHAAVLAVDAGIIHPEECGTERTYRWHRRHGQPTDSLCRGALAAVRREQRHGRTP